MWRLKPTCCITCPEEGLQLPGTPALLHWFHTFRSAWGLPCSGGFPEPRSHAVTEQQAQNAVNSAAAALASDVCTAAPEPHHWHCSGPGGGASAWPCPPGHRVCRGTCRPALGRRCLLVHMLPCMTATPLGGAVKPQRGRSAHFHHSTRGTRRTTVAVQAPHATTSSALTLNPAFAWGLCLSCFSEEPLARLAYKHPTPWHASALFAECLSS